MIRANRQLLPVTAAIAAFGLVAACGIDQGGVRSPAITGSVSTESTVIVTGPISGFGSVVVNGIRLETTSTEVLIDGAPGSESALRIGQIVRAVARRNASGTRATSIEYRSNVTGPVQLVDIATGTFEVLGQAFRIGAETSFDGPLTGLANLGIGDIVEVSGLTLDDESVRASYIGLADTDGPLHITGAITAVDTSLFTIELGELTVDYATAGVLDVLNGLPEAGLIVEVTGTQIDGDVLVADAVRAIAALPGRTSEDATTLRTEEAGFALDSPASTESLEVSLVGIVTATNLPAGIALRDVSVTITNTTEIAGGSAGDLEPGMRVQIDGQIATAGEIDAERITIL